MGAFRKYYFNEEGRIIEVVRSGKQRKKNDFVCWIRAADRPTAIEHFKAYAIRWWKYHKSKL